MSSGRMDYRGMNIRGLGNFVPGQYMYKNCFDGNTTVQQIRFCKSGPCATSTETREFFVDYGKMTNECGW
jgi:hypothetical protein